MIRDEWEMSPTAVLNVVKGHRLRQGVDGPAAGGLSARAAELSPALSFWTVRRWWRTRLLAVVKQSPVSARGVAIGQFIKISIKSLSISTVTCTYPLCGDKITASLCTQANKQSVHALVHGQARRLPCTCTTAAFQ